MNEKVFEIESEAALKEVVLFIRSFVEPGDRIRLMGDLGVGKTTFVRAFLRSLGWDGSIPSPTYPLLLEYEFEDFRVVHIDAFRLNPTFKSEEPWDISEWKDAIVFVEWAERTRIPISAFKGSLAFEFKNSEERGESRKIIWKPAEALVPLENS